MNGYLYNAKEVVAISYEFIMTCSYLVYLMPNYQLVINIDVVIYKWDIHWSYLSVLSYRT